MSLVKKSFLWFLFAIINNILYIDKPYRVKSVAICFPSSENRPQFPPIRETPVNNGDWVVYYEQLASNISTETLELFFLDGIWYSQALTLRYEYVLCEEDESVFVPSREDCVKIFIAVCFIILFPLVLVIKIIIRNVRI